MYNRICPICGKELNHTNEANCKTAIKNKVPCRSCSSKIQIKEKGNPMQGRSLYSVWEEKYGKEEAIRRLKEYGNNRKGKKLNLTPTGKKNRSHIGKDNGNYGKKMKDVFFNAWQKEGLTLEECENRYKETCKKHSLAGDKNPMYGKQSPVGSGNGWSGWYQDYYFRSLLELSYLKYLIDNNIKFETGENKKHSVKYFDTYKKQEATYFPDFYLIDSNQIIEIKPKNLLKAQKNIDKYKAAKKKYKKNFIILTEENINKLSDIQIKEMYDNKIIRFIERYDKKFKEKYNG